MENIIYLYPLQRNLDYNPQFKNLLSKEESGNSYEDILFNQLEEKKASLLAKEKIFYNFFGVNSYKDLQKKWSKVYNDPENIDFLKDYKRITNTQITQDKELYEAISGQYADNLTPKGMLLDENLRNIVKEEFVRVLSLTDFSNNNLDSYLTTIGEYISKRLDTKNYYIKIKGKNNMNFQDALIENLEKETEENLSVLLKNDFLDFFDKNFKNKKNFSFSTNDFLKNGLLKIYADGLIKAFGNNQELILVSKKDGSEIRYDINSLLREKFFRGSVPNINLGLELKENIYEKVSKTNNSVEKNAKNPVPEFRTQQRIKHGKNWISKTVDSDPQARNEIKIKILKYITEDLKLTSETTKNFFTNLSPEQLKQLLAAFTSPSGLIGYLGETYGTLFFNLIVPSAENIGATTKKEFNVTEVDKWRKNYQPPVDILLTVFNKEKGGNYLVGIQSKQSFSFNAQKSHNITFVNPKPIERIFMEDLSEFYFANSINQSFIAELQPLLEAYYANTTIQKIIKSGNGELLSEKENNEALGGVTDALEIINKIFSYFIDNILDLGEYEQFEDSNLKKTILKERNLFYLYLNEYFIPASELISWVENILVNKKSENNSVVKVRNESKKDLSNEILKDREKNLSEIDLSKNRNLAQNILDNILIAIDVNFTDKNIAQFSFIDELWSKNWGGN